MGSGCIVKPFDETDLKKGINIVLTWCRLEKKDVKRNPGELQNIQKDSGLSQVPYPVSTV